MKLNQTKDYLLFIDEEAEIKEGDLCLVTINGWENYHIWIYLSHNAKRDYSYSDLQGNFKKWGIKEKSKIIAYYPLTKEAKELDLPWLPNPFEKRVDIDVLCDTVIGNRTTENFALREVWKDGYKAAQSKHFSLEDIENAFYMGWIMRGEGNTFPIEKRNYIQSLSTQQLPKDFIPEIECYDYHNKTWRNYNGAPELKNAEKKLKTTTNSEGKQELLGTYKY